MLHDLTRNEEILLLSVWRLRDEAYGVRIKEHIREETDRDWNYGTLYCTLDQLARKGFLSKREGTPSRRRGGRRKIYYALTPRGIEALRAAHELQQSLWRGVTPLALGEECS